MSLIVVCPNCGGPMRDHARRCSTCWQASRRSCGNPGCTKADPCGTCRERRRSYAAGWQRRRYAEYRELLSAVGEDPQWDRWQAHLRELAGRPEPLQRLSKEALRQWWTDQFSLVEIREMASGLDGLLREDDGSTFARKIAA